MNDEGSRQHYFLPREIQNYLQQELLTNAFDITKVESIKSAQHVVVIVQVQRRTTHDDDKDHPLDQVVSSKTNSAVIPDQDDNTVLPHDWQDALNMGCNHLVLRIWKGGCRWWNLHQTTTTTTFHTTDKNCGNNNNNQDDQPQQHKAAAVLTLARAEIAGYRMARLCSESLWTLRHDQDQDDDDDEDYCGDKTAAPADNNEKDHDDNIHPRIIIPQVLYFSHENNETHDRSKQHDPTSSDEDQRHASIESKLTTANQHHPDDDSPSMIWAVMAYVGSQSRYFIPTKQLMATATAGTITTSDSSLSNYYYDYGAYDDTWTTTMIPVREEFGWSEPHLRWGRLPISYCWNYAATLLRTWMIPLHEYCFKILTTNTTTPIRQKDVLRQQQPQPTTAITWSQQQEFHRWMMDLAIMIPTDTIQHDAAPNDDHEQQQQVLPSWRGRTYMDMLMMYEQAHQELSETAQSLLGTTTLSPLAAPSSSPPSSSSSAVTSNTTTISNGHSCNCQDDLRDCHMDEADHQKEYVEWQLQWTRWVHQLGECLVQLKQQALFLDLAPIFVTEDNKTSVNQTQVQGRRWLPPVLCHMDCQPQNLLCYRRRLESRVHNTPSSQRAKVNDASFLTPDNDANHDSTSIRIVSILDWEDAALADPRFEIMMLCRKVCANLDQARWVWNLYANECRIIGRSGDDDDKKVAIGIERMGPIEPWLQLETVHSITTLLLQSVKSVVGSSNDGSTLTCQPLNGRNPWETPKDVQAKLQQEFQRLKTQWPIQIEP